jgi:hypothetical protein
MVIKQVALQEVVSKVLSEPIRPQFAIANVIESGVDYLSETLYLVRYFPLYFIYFFVTKESLKPMALRKGGYGCQLSYKSVIKICFPNSSWPFLLI